MQNNYIELYPFRLNTNGFDLAKEYIDEILNSFSNAFNIFIDTYDLQNPLKKGLYFQKSAKYINLTIKDIPIQKGLVSSEVKNDAIQITLHYDLVNGTATPIHELFHVFQYSYSNINNMWFMEGLARWSQNLTHKRKDKNEKLPSNIDELEILLYKKHNAEYFWRRLLNLCGNQIDFMKTFLEGISQYNNKITDKKALSNNKYIFLSLIKTIEQLTTLDNDELKAFIKLLKNSIKQEIKEDYDFNTDTLIIDCLDCTNKSLKEIEFFNNIKHITGDLTISSNNLVNLNCFNNLKTLGGILKIIDNENLQSINGFNSLESLKSLHIEKNRNLTSIHGFRTLFQNTKEITGYLKIINNKKLTSINFMHGLKSVGSSFYLHNNSLKDLKGLEYLEEVGASFSISNNGLRDISALKNLIKINGMLNILNNNRTTLNGLENLKSLKTTKWNGRNITISIANNKNLQDIEALKNVQTFDNDIILYFDWQNNYTKKPDSDSDFYKNVLELYDFKTNIMIPIFKEEALNFMTNKFDYQKALLNFNSKLKRENKVKWPFVYSIKGMTVYLKLYNMTLENEKVQSSLNLLIVILNDLGNHLLRIKESNPLFNVKDKYYITICGRLNNFFLHQEIDKIYLNINIWKCLSSVMILNKYFISYLNINTKMRSDIKNIFIVKDKNIIKYKRYIDINEKDFIAYCFENRYEQFIDKDLKDKFPELLGFGSLYSGNLQKYIEKFEYIQADNMDFSSYIKGKTIAIVGPADTHQLNGKEIDDYDIVIRFNFKNMQGYSKEIYGSKTDISYYVILNDKNIKDLDIDNNFKYINQLQYFIATDKLTFRKLQKERKLTVKYRTRLIPHSINRNPYLNGSANAVQKCLFDILRFQPAKIKIFNVDLWISSINKNYLTGKVKTKYFAWHDPISNFIFLKKMFDNSLIEADKVLSNLLKMTNQEYIKKLEEIYDNKN